MEDTLAIILCRSEKNLRVMSFGATFTLSAHSVITESSGGRFSCNVANQLPFSVFAIAGKIPQPKRDGSLLVLKKPAAAVMSGPSITPFRNQRRTTSRSLDCTLANLYHHILELRGRHIQSKSALYEDRPDMLILDGETHPFIIWLHSPPKSEHPVLRTGARYPVKISCA